jgi:hypothetical protein
MLTLMGLIPCSGRAVVFQYDWPARSETFSFKERYSNISKELLFFLLDRLLQ